MELLLKVPSDRRAPRFDRKFFFPPEWNHMAAAYLELFHRFSYILKPLEGGSWFSAQESWQLTDSAILKAAACQDKKYYIGVRAGRATRYAVLDIDAGSKYHNRISIERMRSVLKTAGIGKTVIYRSSWSGGWHLYIFFDEPVSSTDLRKQLINLLKLNGLTIAKGTLEIFPHPGDEGGSLGQGLRLPLQPGFAWLDQITLDVEHERAELTATKALTYFMDECENGNSRHEFHALKSHVENLLRNRSSVVDQFATPRVRSKHQTGVNHQQPKNPPAQSGAENDWIGDFMARASDLDIFEETKCTTSVSKELSTNNVVALQHNANQSTPETHGAAVEEDSLSIVIEVFGAVPPNISAERWLRGRRYAFNGLTGPTQRADAVHCLSHYLFYGDPEYRRPALGYGYEQERTWAIEKILNDKHHGWSEDINSGRGDALTHPHRAANWLPPERRGTELKKFEQRIPASWARNNANRKADARQRIEHAVAEYKQSNQAFSLRDLRERASCSIDTLYAHEDLWRETQTKLRTGDRLATDPHKYNAGEGAASQESQPPAPLTPNLMPPPGLLAARRIIFEMKRRAQRDATEKFKRANRFGSGTSEIWRQKVIEWLPSGIPIAGSKQLIATLSVYQGLLISSPDEESQLWLQSKITAIEDELTVRKNDFVMSAKGGEEARQIENCVQQEKKDSRIDDSVSIF